MNSTARANELNRTCGCESVAADTSAHFYSRTPVFIGVAQMRQMQSLMDAIHRVVALPAWQHAVLAESPAIAAHQPRAQGVFAGFDFHMTDEGPKLIEINTNAGGAMLNAVAEWRHPDCCDELNRAVRVPARREVLERAFMDMFLNEWRLARGDRPLKTLAIVDDHPDQQFLYAEFRLFEELFVAHGIDAFVTDAAALEYSGRELKAGNRTIDLVYNRLTDFYFEDAVHSALRKAYESDAVVITPHPRAHALVADKRNLVRLTDENLLRTLGVQEADVATLNSGIPRTRLVEGCPESWWRDRKGWFFKPSAGFGSRGAYRGDKITRRAFGDVMRGGYVAQQLAPPGERVRVRPEGSETFKVDVRCYVYDRAVQLLAARLYQGQTTNFRTAGGGFSPVIELLDV